MAVDLEVPTLTYTDANGEHRIPVDRDKVSIGRSPGQDVVLPDPCVSRQHAIIVKEGADFTIVDQKSSYGTFRAARRRSAATWVSRKLEAAVQDAGAGKGP
jgi:pSer/pThr/pTyr-binding forkhead associated (FHA) protein